MCSTNIWEDLQHFLVIRLKDNYPNARIAAISGLHRLHDPTSKKDKVVKEFTRILSTDPLKYDRFPSLFLLYLQFFHIFYSFFPLFF